MFRVRIGDAPGTPIRKQVVTSNSMLIVAGCYPCAKCANRPSNKARPNGRIAKRPKRHALRSDIQKPIRAPQGAQKKDRYQPQCLMMRLWRAQNAPIGSVWTLATPKLCCRPNSGQSGSSLPFHFELALRRSDCMASSRACMNLTSDSTNESAARTMTLSFVRMPWFVEAYPLNCRSLVKSSG
jgi:hypothetical protein